MMNRFRGMMPAEEIKISRVFDDDNGMRVRIDAGPHGWTIGYADLSTQYQDIDDSSENNFAAARDVLRERFPNAREIRNPESYVAQSMKDKGYAYFVQMEDDDRCLYFKTVEEIGPFLRDVYSEGKIVRSGPIDRVIEHGGKSEI